jgi:hypothetical protein
MHSRVKCTPKTLAAPPQNKAFGLRPLSLLITVGSIRTLQPADQQFPLIHHLRFDEYSSWPTTLDMALFGLLLVFFIVCVAITLFAFPPNKIVEWMSKPASKPGDKKN